MAVERAPSCLYSSCEKRAIWLTGKQLTSLAPVITLPGAAESPPFRVGFIPPGPQAVSPWESDLASLDLHLFHLCNWEKSSLPPAVR